ncbi:FIST N-terminal domain-containing protein [Flavobacterium sp. SUN046]|uniref:FIST signal transduction protein n=1 Tax=Flavobacterium sp. SUN046 TaxID=3002440 RepID=UPI002DBBBE2F|nr:FIST N-terminal domain-containing protein [Flavobacterium sp. SUN046]MEC4049262.1 FIST N-terminal domain-containing protein [Flavobacterium sp. SUN046]
MKIVSVLYKGNEFIREKNCENLANEDVDLVLGFGSSELISLPKSFSDIKLRYPNAQIALCSSAGEIFNTEVLDDSISLIALSFDYSQIKTADTNIKDYQSSFEAGEYLVNELSDEKLKFIFVLSDGGSVNGSELVKGMNSVKAEGVLITGGLAGDGTRFEKTYVGLNKLPAIGNILAIGFYGDKLELSHGSIGGWESFGLKRTVTNSKGNVLYKIDNENALDLYKSYLGKYADELPGSALLFPLSIKINENESIVRTILSIDEKNQTMTFAGDVPEGSEVRFMKANFDRLIDAASDVASNCLEMSNNPKLALLISCVGRKIILGNRIDEEVEAVSEVFGKTITLSGFYSYGEISPLKPMENCELHNQTMTITCINEIE